MHRQPQPISAAEQRERTRRVRRIARRIGFAGRVEFRHLYSQSGGARFCIGPNREKDSLVVYAEAIERDRDPADFSLQAIIAHECGHRALLRNPQCAAIVKKLAGALYEEVLASLIGSLLVNDHADSRSLVEKATFELAILGLSPATTIRTIERLLRLLGQLL